MYANRLKALAARSRFFRGVDFSSDWKVAPAEPYTAGRGRESLQGDATVFQNETRQKPRSFDRNSIRLASKSRLAGTKSNSFLRAIVSKFSIPPTGQLTPGSSVTASNQRS